MIRRPFREHHLLALLTQYEKQQLPLDLFISQYFRDHKALGSKDRGFIADTIYAMIRWQGLLDYLCQTEATWEKRFELFQSSNLSALQQDPSIPPHIRVSFPKSLFDQLIENYGEKAIEICLNCNQTAPTTVRVNPMKTTRDALIEKWKDKYSISECQYSPYGIRFHQKIHFFSTPEFLEGLFEVQDEGSQLLGLLVKAKPGQQVMDYCAGSGGKTLAFASQMEGKGQIYVHDIRPHVLTEARRRLRRAGIQNAQTVLADHPNLKRLKKHMDWVLVDAPCSGTGTLRRNPDMKWKYNEEMLQRLIGQQRYIFEKALSFLKPGGHIIYSTCSILKQENEEQMNHFIKTYNLQVEETFQTVPSEGNMDGFFAAVFKSQG